MNKRVKRSNCRQRGFLGLVTALGSLIGAAAGVYGASNAAKAAKRAQKDQTFASNLDRLASEQQNDMNLINDSQTSAYNDDKTKEINTIDTNYRCGGKKRVKRCGGTVTSNIKKLSKYI